MPLEPGEEFPRVHGDDRFFYAKTFATCSSKRGSTVGGMAAHRRLHRRRVYRLVDDSDNVRSGRQRSITVGRRCNSNTPARNLWTSRGIGQGLRSWLETTGRVPLSRDFYRLAIPGMKNCNWYGCGLLIVALACATLSGCETTGTEASSTASASTAFMSASSSKNAGHLIIQRLPDLGTAEVLNISIDGKQVATLPRGQTYSGSLSPGQHVVSVLAIPNALHLLPTQKRLSVQAGQTYDFTAMWQANRLVLM